MTTMAATPSPGVNVASHGRRFVVNASLGLVSKAAHLAASVFLVAYVLRHLGLERFGLVVASATIVAFLGLIQTGAAAGLGRQFNLLLSRGDMKSFSRYYSAGLILSVLVAALICGGLALLLSVFWQWTGIPAGLAREGRWILGMLGVASAVACLALPAVACLQAAHRLDVIEKAQLVGVIARVVGTVALFEVLGPRPEFYVLILLLEQLLVSAFTVVARALILPEVSFETKNVHAPLLREVAGFNALNLVANVNYVAFMQVPAIVLARFEGLAFAGLYGVGLQLNNLFRGLLQPVVNALSPVATSLHAVERAEAFQRLFLLSTKCFLAAALLLWTLFFFLGDSLLHFWLRRDVGPLTQALPWLIGASAFGVAAMPASVFSLALGRVRLPALAGLLLALGMSVALVWSSSGGWQPGLVRAGVWLTVFFGAYQAVRVLDVASALKVGGVSLLKVAVRAALPSIAAGVVLGISTLWLEARSAAAVAVILVLSISAAAAVVYAGFFSVEERELLSRLRSTVRPVASEEARS